jgi:hypothetical protein
MPRPFRVAPLASLDIRICRPEVQKVLKKYHSPDRRAGRLDALTCLGMFDAASNLTDPDVHAVVAGYLHHYPEAFSDLVRAFYKSEKRLMALRAATFNALDNIWSSDSRVHSGSNRTLVSGRNSKGSLNSEAGVNLILRFWIMSARSGPTYL